MVGAFGKKYTGEGHIKNIFNCGRGLAISLSVSLDDLKRNSLANDTPFSVWISPMNE